MPTWSIRPALPAEWSAGLRLLLGLDLPAQHLAAAVDSVTLHLKTGTLDPAAFFVALAANRVVGAALGQCLPGAQALLFDVPHAEAAHPEATLIEDHLLATLLAWLQTRGSKMVQCLLPLAETIRATALLRGSFRYVTALHYLMHYLETPLPQASQVVQFERYEPAQCDLLAATIAATYEGTLDCPELNDVLSIAEVIAGHERKKDAQTLPWWLVREEGQIVGVLLMQHAGMEQTGEVAYMGLLPKARGRGLGQAIMHYALEQAMVAGLHGVLVCVDARNVPAVQLYRRLGFVPWEEKALFLALLPQLVSPDFLQGMSE